MDNLLINLIGKDTLTTEQVTYATYAIMAVTTLLTIILLRSFITNIFFAKNKKMTAGGSHVLIVGSQRTGKTVLTNVIIQGTKPQYDTVTSMQPTRRSGLVDGVTLTLTDFPGSSQAKNASLDQQLEEACGVVFVVDARCGKLVDEARATAALMKRVLVNATFRSRRTPVLVVFNKIDLVEKSGSGGGGGGGGAGVACVGDSLENSKWLQSHRALLQRELNAIKDELLTSTGAANSSSSSHQLGTEQAFDFEMDVDSDVHFCVCTSEMGRKGVADVIKFCCRVSQ